MACDVSSGAPPDGGAVLRVPVALQRGQALPVDASQLSIDAVG